MPGLGSGPGSDADAVQRAHVARLGALDAALAPQRALDPAAGSWHAVGRPDGSSGVGVSTVTEVAADAPVATFRALREHRLRGRVAGPDVRGALGDLLDGWGSAVAGTHAEPSTDDVLAVTWPSRDVEAVSALLDRGFAPTSVLAVRQLSTRADGPRAPGPTGVRVRDAVPADADAVVALQLAELGYDALVGSARLRAATPSVLAAAVPGVIARPATTLLVAEVDGEPVGVVGVDDPSIASEASAALVHDRVAYVVVLHVDAAARGRGVGRLLVDAALERVGRSLDVGAGGSAAVALHHSALNPLSAPFWARSGFRPVLTSWERPTAPAWAPVSARTRSLVP
ncbi:GNAT family N-acetyltransferase [Cellulosimicrobium terreum]|nr:GNAT family N-acetyltransferase [Cellulosimicrobium terreum]